MEKKVYCVSVDVTMATHLYVEAASEEEAKRLADEKIKADPYNYVRNYTDAYVSHEISDVILDV